jgi:hypothetical protein
LTETILAPIVDGPVVNSLTRVTNHGMTKTLVITFSAALNPTPAQEASEYQVLTVLGHHKGNPRLGHPIGVASAVVTGPVVTLTLRKPISSGSRYQLTILGTPPGGLTDTSGLFLDGQNTGTPGSNYTTFFSQKSLPRQ